MLNVTFLCALPDRIVGDVGVLGVNPSHHGAWRCVLLNLKRVAGSHKNGRLVRILHRYLRTDTRTTDYRPSLTQLNAFFFHFCAYVNMVTSCWYLYRGFISIRSQSNELWVEMWVGSVHPQSVRPLRLKVHFLSWRKKMQIDKLNEFISIQKVPALLKKSNFKPTHAVCSGCTGSVKCMIDPCCIIVLW